MISILSRGLQLVRRLARTQPSKPTRYAGAVLVVAFCCALRAQLPFAALPYLFFIPGLMFIGFCFGVGPSLLGCMLSVLAAHYFFIGAIGFQDGLTAWISSASFALVTFGMAVVCALFRRSLNALSDINERLEYEVERRTLERDGIWNVSPDLICTLSEGGEVVAMNPAWQTETGHTEQVLKDGAFFAFISPSQLFDALRSLDQQPIAELDTQGARSNGQPLHLNWRIARREGYYFAVARDITQHKERQEALEQVRAQLQQSQKMEAVGQLTGGLAHDFNNLLTVITSSLDLLDQRIAQGRHSELPRYVALARNASARAGSLTHRLLAYARRQTLASTVVDPALLIQDMKEMISRTLTPRVELEVATPQESILCLCDAHQLENALLNLCINARDAMPQGGRLRIEVSKQRIEPAQATETLNAGEYAHFQVTDTGMGMPQSVVERAFDPFFTTKPLGSGTGLGLSMVYGFTRQSSGDAQIESEVGKGTKVNLFLPLHYGTLTTANLATPSNSEDVAYTPSGLILVVDDEDAIRDLVGETLEDMGYEVAKAATAAEALQLLKQLPEMGLMITDIGLPGGMSGDELAVAALDAHPALKVLFISGYAENAVPAIAMKSGQTELLLKPFAVTQFKLMVQKLLT
ncbi:PAS domain S-box-containing protein [Pseudomonas sp. BIGb0408]|uniref:histidine kinase n=1 Tax=Phytopseudomonas flavescens TaxID=29435 RepID=A0A7Z0BNN9_9GAMM|nr:MULTISPECIES: ATP-binding protein [Pseudomonas]MCW2292358.1 PAS domain S-box-containing protein [Pseudomonas sp. BIGb0408]NYH73070.1 PAS domain S-box-containing protein [Pseudomonas flavescens]